MIEELYIENLKTLLINKKAHHANLISSQFENLNTKLSENIIKIIEETIGLKEVFEIDKEKITKKELCYVLDFFTTKSDTSSYYLLMIKNSEMMDEQAANSFLKFLEEPPKNLFIFLLTTNINSILKTIQSRCKIININNSEKYSLKVLNEINKINIFDLSKKILLLPKEQIINEFEIFYELNYTKFNKRQSKEYLEMCERFSESSFVKNNIESLLSLI